MTTTSTAAPATSTGLRPPRPAQWAVLTRMLLGAAMNSLLITTGVVLACLAVGVLVARWRGWQLVGMTETDMVGLEVIADGDGVTLVASLFILPVAVGIASVVMAVVLAARTRVYVATGATRRAVATAQLLTVLGSAAYVLLVTAVVLLVVGRGPDGALALLQADGAGDVAILGVSALGAVLLGMAGATMITALFLRWPWWVGVGLLLLLFVVLPPVTTFLLPAVGAAVDRASGWWGWDLSVAVVVAALFWWILRRVPVR
ncbi:hypothetical protein ACQE98_10300 [Ornithinimicrobium sp. W1679]|uniref:hypothetical protein n=1 Tax=Ornithinimicrobium sp. W1679 TaxID=3418770 RepID=UPI003CF44EB1